MHEKGVVGRCSGYSVQQNDQHWRAVEVTRKSSHCVKRKTIALHDLTKVSSFEDRRPCRNSPLLSTGHTSTIFNKLPRRSLLERGWYERPTILIAHHLPPTRPDKSVLEFPASRRLSFAASSGSSSSEFKHCEPNSQHGSGRTNCDGRHKAPLLNLPVWPSGSSQSIPRKGSVHVLG